MMFNIADLVNSSLGEAGRLALAEIPSQSARHPGIRLAILRIREKFGQNLTTEKLSEAAGLSKSQFMAAFKRETGFTPHEYLRRVRIGAALRLLQAGKNVTETCFEVGFTSLSGFKQAFVELTGVLPNEISKNPASPRQ